MRDESQMNPKRVFAVAKKKNEMNSERKINVAKKDIQDRPIFSSFLPFIIFIYILECYMKLK